MTQLSLLTDRELVQSLGRTVSVHRRNMAAIIEHLGEMDARGAALDIGHGSLFAYCVNELHFTEDEACRRINAARLARRFAGVLPRVADGSVSLTVLGLVNPHLTESNCDELLELVTGVTVQIAKERLAARFPLPDAPALIRAVPVRSSANAAVTASPSLAPALPIAGLAAVQSCVPMAPPTPPSPAPLSKQLEPRSADRFTLRITINRVVKEKIDRARGLLSHRVPNGDLEAIVSMAIDELVQRLEAKKFGATKRPRARRTTERPIEARAPMPPAATSKPRPAVPNETRRAVVARDGARCSHVGTDGRRCESTSFLEFDHVHPVALGGATDVDNLRILCRAHNQREAERVFGGDYMRAARRRNLTVKETVLLRLTRVETDETEKTERIEIARSSSRPRCVVPVACGR